MGTFRYNNEDGGLRLKDDTGNVYQDSFVNFELDAGVSLPALPGKTGYYNNTEGFFKYSDGSSESDGPYPNTSIDAWIASVPDLLAAQATRNLPPEPTDQEIRAAKVMEVKMEGLRRAQLAIPGILTFDQLGLMKEQWLSIAPGARQATANFQTVINVYQAGADAVSVVKNLATIAEVQAYDVVTDPFWP